MTVIVIAGIANAEYDALCETLDVEFLPNGEHWRFYDVSEEVWYEWRMAKMGKDFFRTNISGNFFAEKIGTAAK